MHWASPSHVPPHDPPDPTSQVGPPGSSAAAVQSASAEASAFRARNEPGTSLTIVAASKRAQRRRSVGVDTTPRVTRIENPPCGALGSRNASRTTSLNDPSDQTTDSIAEWKNSSGADGFLKR